MSRVIYVELDGTLVEQGTMKPVEAVVRMIKGALANGDTVHIVSKEPRTEQFKATYNLCKKHFGENLAHVGEVDFADMTEFWSHRVLQLELNTGRRMVPRKSFGG